MRPMRGSGELRVRYVDKLVLNLTVVSLIKFMLDHRHKMSYRGMYSSVSFNPSTHPSAYHPSNQTNPFLYFFAKRLCDV